MGSADSTLIRYSTRGGEGLSKSADISSTSLESNVLFNQDCFGALWHDPLIDEQQFVDVAVHIAIGYLRPLALKGVDPFIDPPIKVQHDLLRADHPDEMDREVAVNISAFSATSSNARLA